MSGDPGTPVTRLLRTLRLDPSDTFVFDRAAAPGEWAVPGSFMFWGQDPGGLDRRRRHAFRAGFLGLESFGWSTLAVVVAATAEDRAAAVHALARHLVDDHGAPDLDTATVAAAEEIAFVESLAHHPEQTLVAMHRTIRDDGTFSEQFRTFHAADVRRGAAMACSAGAFAIVEDTAAHDEAMAEGEVVDLAAILGATPVVEAGP